MMFVLVFEWKSGSRVLFFHRCRYVSAACAIECGYLSGRFVWRVDICRGGVRMRVLRIDCCVRLIEAGS